MKFSCTKSELVQAIQTVAKAVSSKPQTPILSGIYLKAEKGQLELQATDYDMGILCHIPADVETEGAIVLSGRYLQDVVRRLPGENVNVSFDTFGICGLRQNDEALLHLKTENDLSCVLAVLFSECRDDRVFKQ